MVQAIMTAFSPKFPNDTEPAGVYIHIPFCARRCRYCGFISYPYERRQEEGYVQSLAKEISLRAQSRELQQTLKRIRVDSIYFGGGTPSLFSSQGIGSLIEACQAAFPVIDCPEITVEINPASGTSEQFGNMRLAGVNRVSLGIQSLNDEELRLMGRLHRADDAVAAFHELRSCGFDNISVDLVAGFPGQTLDSVRASVRGVLDLRPEHLSVYLLEIKEGTSLHADVQAGRVRPLDDDLVAEMYEEIWALAGKRGYEHYEISNFALDGHRSRHNLKYWHDSLYVGLGVAAHGMTGRRRYANIDDPEAYRAALNGGKLPEASSDQMSPETRFKDALIMGLRLVQGIDLDHIGRRYGVDAVRFVRDTTGDLEDAGLYAIQGSRISLTARGRLISNVVFSRWV